MRFGGSLRTRKGASPTAEENFKALEAHYRAVLLAIGFPGVSQNDMVVMNRRTLIPETWTNVGMKHASGHSSTPGPVARKRLLIIDSPMKNITPDVNPRIFRSFYLHLYSLFGAAAERIAVCSYRSDLFRAD